MQNFGTVAAGNSVTYKETITVTEDETCIATVTGECNGLDVEDSQDVSVTLGQSEDCTAGLGRYYGASSHQYTLANMLNWTNNYLSISFTNWNHTQISSVRVHTTSRTPSYYAGNGGTFKLHLYTDNGNNEPGVLLGSTPDYIGATSLTGTSGPWASQAQAQSTYPNAVWSSYGESGGRLVYHRRYNFTSPINVQPCTRYHIVMQRTTSNSHGTSLNGMFTGSMPKWDDPCVPTGDWLIHTSSNGTSWNNLNHVGIFEVYGDGITIGQAQHEIAAFSDADRSNNINGSSAARQCWVPHKTMEINTLRIQAARRSGTAPLQYQIKNSGGTVLRSGTISGYPVITTTDIRQTPNQMERIGDDFAKLQVTAGQTYYIELKTTSGTWYEIGMTRDGVLSGYYELDPEYHGWGPNSTAEVSYNNGSTWVRPTNWGNLQDYLAIEGDVGQCADGVNSCIEDMCACNFS